MGNNDQNNAFAYIAKTAGDFSSLTNLCAYARYNGSMMPDDIGDLSELMRIEGLTMMLLTHGSLNISLNTETYTITAPTCTAFRPGAVLKVDSDDWREIDLHLIYVSTELIPDINVSFSAIAVEALAQKSRPGVNLNERETSVFVRYFKLLHSVMLDAYHPTLCRHIVANLITALIYQMTLASLRSISIESKTNTSASRNSYITEFIKLVHINFMKERSVNYYADRLCISSKYLSQLVKEGTGHSASRWIDHFVITEARNMLRFSGKNIQQVAYALNFANQSSFGKYFKHLTGMSPTEFQKKG